MRSALSNIVITPGARRERDIRALFRGMAGFGESMAPLFATALIGGWAGSMACRKRLYHELVRDFLPHSILSWAEGKPKRGEPAV